MTVHPVAVVCDSDADLSRWVTSRRQHHPTVFAIDVPPGEMLKPRIIADAVLVGLGKNPGLTVGKNAATSLAAAWLSIREHSDALIVDAQLISIELVVETIGQLLACGIRPWLLLATPPGRHRTAAVAEHLAVVERLGGRVVTVDELHHQFPDRTTPPVAQWAASALPVLPSADGFVFRSVCRNLLDSETFAQVDALFVESVRRFRDELDQVTGGHKTRRFENVLKAVLVATATRDEFVLELRAAQVAALTKGFHVAVTNTFLFGAIEAVPRAGKASVENWWPRLDAYYDPVYGAVAALYTAGVPVDDITALDVDDISDPDGDGSVQVTARTVTVTLPAESARFVLAQQSLRRLGGMAVLITVRPDTKRSTRHVIERLATPVAEIGVRVADIQTRNRPVNVTTWLHRHGIVVSKLDRTAVRSDVRDRVTS